MSLNGLDTCGHGLCDECDACLRYAATTDAAFRATCAAADEMRQDARIERDTRIASAAYWFSVARGGSDTAAIRVAVVALHEQWERDRQAPSDEDIASIAAALLEGERA